MIRALLCAGALSVGLFALAAHQGEVKPQPAAPATAAQPSSEPVLLGNGLVALDGITVPLDAVDEMVWDDEGRIVSVKLEAGIEPPASAPAPVS